jgi:hypothetical protein
VADTDHLSDRVLLSLQSVLSVAAEDRLYRKVFRTTCQQLLDAPARSGGFLRIAVRGLLSPSLVVLREYLEPIRDRLVSHVSGNAKQGPRRLQVLLVQHFRLHDDYHELRAKASRIVPWNVFSQDTPVTFQLPLTIRTIGEPIGYSDLAAFLASSHRDARLLAVGHNLLQAQLSVAENGH